MFIKLSKHKFYAELEDTLDCYTVPKLPLRQIIIIKKLRYFVVYDFNFNENKRHAFVVFCLSH